MHRREIEYLGISSLDISASLNMCYHHDFLNQPHIYLSNHLTTFTWPLTTYVLSAASKLTERHVHMGLPCITFSKHVFGCFVVAGDASPPHDFVTILCPHGVLELVRQARQQLAPAKDGSFPAAERGAFQHACAAGAHPLQDERELDWCILHARARNCSPTSHFSLD